MVKDKNLFYSIILSVYLIIFLLSTYQLMLFYLEYRNMDKVYQDLNKSVIVDVDSISIIENNDLMDQAPVIDMEALKLINHEICGYIMIPDTKISYPIAYSTDSSKYLTHDIYNNPSRSGSIFIDAYDEPDFTDSSVIIHGHNMIDDTMFGQLHRYIDNETFFKDHPYIYIVTEKNTYLYRVFSAANININNENIYNYSFSNDDDLKDYVMSRISHSVFRLEILPSVDEIKNIITLSTCVGVHGDERTIVQAYMIRLKTNY